MTASPRKVIRVSTLTFVLALERLMSGPSTARDIEEATGLHRDTVYRLLTAMCAKRVAHEHSMAPDAIGRMSVRVYALGPEPGKDPQISSAIR